MILEHVGLSQINGSLVVLDGVQNASYDEMVVMKLTDGTQRVGRIVTVSYTHLVCGWNTYQSECEPEKASEKGHTGSGEMLSAATG